MVEPIKVGRFIAQNRKNLNLTQKELAEKLGVTDRAVSKWENGRSIPDVGIIESLCKELNISIGEFFAGEKIQEKEYKKEDRKEHKKRCSHMVCVAAPFLFHRKYRDTFMCESGTFL